jgi:hypothetical protein
LLDGEGGDFGAGEIFVRVDSGERDGMWCYMETLTKDGELRGRMMSLDLWGLP